MTGPQRGCLTCRERKVLCDRTSPLCRQCRRTGRRCKGYGLRLSWPSPSDKRRAIVARPASAGKDSNEASSIAGLRLVSASSWDIQLHYHLTASTIEATWPVYPLPMTWNPSVLNVGDKDLFQYFQTVASKAIPTFGQDCSELGNVLVRIAVDGKSPSSAALLRSLLALSSLHRHGVQSQAMELKISSIRALAAASHADLGTKEVIQHVATGMLLCSFEVHEASCTSSQWTWYISGVRKLIRSSPFLRHWGNTELSALMDWVYYYEIMARFTLRHWHHDAQRLDPKTTSIWSDVCTDTAEGRIFTRRDVRSSATLATLELLSDACDAIPNRPPSVLSPDDRHGYRGLIQLLDWRIRNVQMSHTTSMGIDEEGYDEEKATVELYQLAILVYLNRVSANILGQEEKTQQRIKTAFSLFARLDSCERQFPLFILGCEARTDEERAVVLDLMARTEKRSSSRSLNHIRLMTQAIWTQDDLASKEIDYWDKMTAIVSRCSILPSLV